MTKPKPIYRTDGEWMALVYQGHLFDVTGEWAGWLDGDQVYLRDGVYLGYISRDGRLLRRRVLSYRKRRTPPSKHPRCPIPASVPLPPMFAEISYDTIDVFEENPDVLGVVNELRPDAGEKSLHRLVDSNPELAAKQKLHLVRQDMLEQMTYSIVCSYGTTQPPVPVEAMAAGRRPGNLDGIQNLSPPERVRLAQQLIERLGHSTWALEKGYCGPEGFTPPEVAYAARALLLPRHWILKASEQRQPISKLARRYIVPKETATLRLHDLE